MADDYDITMSAPIMSMMSMASRRAVAMGNVADCVHDEEVSTTDADGFISCGVTKVYRGTVEQDAVMQLVRDKDVMRIGNAVHVFMPSVNFWVPLSTNTGLCYLRDVVGLNAPVNFAAAVRPYLFLISNTFVESASRETIDGTVVLCGCRMTYAVIIVSGIPSMVYTAMETGKAGFATISPLMGERIPLSVALAPAFERLKSVMFALRHDQQMLLLYYLGKILGDPTAITPVMVLHGKNGGEGKGGLVNRLNKLLDPIMTNISSSVFDTKAPVVKLDDVLEISSNVIVSIDEADIKDGMNLRNLKMLKSGGTISVEGLVLNMCTMILVMTNYMPKTTKADATNSICRRRVMFNCTNTSIAESPSGDFDQQVVSTQEKHALVSCALFVASMRKTPPCSIKIATTSIFGPFVNSLMAGIVERAEYDVDDFTAKDVLDSMLATRVISMRAQMDVNTLATCFMAFSPDLVAVCETTRIKYLPAITMDPMLALSSEYKKVIEEVVEIHAGTDVAMYWFGGANLDIDWNTLNFRGDDD